jgi:2'-5' RNA ligase
VRWVDTATTHITLHFFAELALDRVEGLVEAVGDAVAREQPFSLRLGGLGSFPGGARSGWSRNPPPLPGWRQVSALRWRGVGTRSTPVPSART